MGFILLILSRTGAAVILVDSRAMLAGKRYFALPG